MDEENDIQLAHNYRLSLLSPPNQSSFRVVAILFYELDDDCSTLLSPPRTKREMPNKVPRHHVVGTNDEPCYIGGSICAERAALVQLRFLPNLKRISKIVISTDSATPISPGMLCREFLASHTKVSWDMPIVLASSRCRCCRLDISSNAEDPSASDKVLLPCPQSPTGHDWAPINTTLRQLYPHPSPYIRLGARGAVKMGEQIAKGLSSQNMEPHRTSRSAGVLSEQAPSLIQKAVLASRGDSRSDLHPIQYGAAVLFSDGATSMAYQKKALEYGCTLDAVTQLAAILEENRNNAIHPVLLVQADQFGVVHPPFAPARAYLSEHGYGKCRVIVPCSVEGTDLTEVLASDLAPSAPDMGTLWSDS